MVSITNLLSDWSSTLFLDTFVWTLYNILYAQWSVSLLSWWLNLPACSLDSIPIVPSLNNEASDAWELKATINYQQSVTTQLCQGDPTICGSALVLSKATAVWKQLWYYPPCITHLISLQAQWHQYKPTPDVQAIDACTEQRTCALFL